MLGPVSIGLDRDAGLPSGFATDVKMLIPAHTGILAVLTGTGTDSVWEYDGMGWHFVYKSTGVIYGAQVLKLSGVSYRLYVTQGTGDTGVLNYRLLDVGHVNPDVATISYEGTDDLAVHETPWFSAGQNDIDKTAVRIRVECSGMSSDETAKIQFYLNYGALDSDNFTITADGVTERTFPTIANNNSEAGQAFRSIKFKITLNRGSTATDTPNVKSLSLEWRRKLKARYGFTFDIDRTSRYAGRSPKQQKAALVTAFEQATMAELTYVDDDGDTQNYYVDITSVEDVQETGHGEAGVTRITAVES